MPTQSESALEPDAAELASVRREESRQNDFAGVCAALADHLLEVGRSDCLVTQGDSLQLLEKLPDASVSLILTDPPYHSTKKSNIAGDRAFEEDEEFIAWMSSYAAQWKRVLKLSGTLYVFCSSVMSARLEVALAQCLRPIAHITWSKPNDPGFDGWKGKAKKESLRTWYPHSERILVFEQGAYGSHEAYRRSPMGEYLLARRRESGLTMVELTGIIGEYGRVNRGGAVANWEAGRNVPSRSQYAKIVTTLEATGNVEQMLEYDDLVRPMNISNGVEFTDVWDFKSVRPFPGKHPAEKPQDMLRHIIGASSNPGDVVLDCFSGSGSTGVAALTLHRRAVCMELEANWAEIAARELRSAYSDDQPARYISPRSVSVEPLFNESLFS